MNPQTITIDSLSTFISIIKTNDKIWYRGQSKEDNKLWPSLFRHPQKSNSPQEVFEREKQILAKFKQRSIPYLQNRIDNNFEYLFLMQHYGIPTRLLDWTENPFVALYFALCTSVYKDDCNAAFYSIFPSEWNKLLLSEIGQSDKIYDISDELIIKGYAIAPPSFDFVRPYPIAINGNYNNQRIVAQRGAFIIFGKEIKSMDEIFDEKFNGNQVLKKYIILKENKKQLFDDLINIGITDAVIFPDMEGLGKEIKRTFGYEVK